jgi:hypothetical protein
MRRGETWILGSIFLPATSDYSVRLLPERVPGMVEEKSLEHGESTAFWALGGAGAACSAVQGKTFRRERGGEGCDRAGFCLLVFVGRGAPRGRLISTEDTCPVDCEW